MIERGIPLLQVAKNKRTKNEEIMAMVLDGKRASEICLVYPQMYANIYKLMRWRPQRSFRTDLVYYYGPPGTGKTTSVSRVLSTIRKLYPQVDYYSKMGGL